MNPCRVVALLISEHDHDVGLFRGNHRQVDVSEIGEPWTRARVALEGLESWTKNWKRYITPTGRLRAIRQRLRR